MEWRKPLLLVRISFDCCFCSVLLYVQQYIYKNAIKYLKKLKFAVRLGSSGVSVARIIGPISAGMIFASTASSDLSWPFNFRFVFHVVSVVLLFAALVSFAFVGDVSKKRQAQ